MNNAAAIPANSRSHFIDRSGRAAAGRSSQSRDVRDGQQGGDRYRVDAEYRDYSGPTSSDSATYAGAEAARARKISSSELLDSMIQRMGGGASSYAKGNFVDISI